jgi:hypothetical protein
VSAKEEILTSQGRENATLPGLTFRTLEDIYTAIAQVMQREDITRALPKEQDRIVNKALSERRTLLIIDNLDSVDDNRVKFFLRNLPMPTKAIITSREWIDVADLLPLTGLPFEESERLITEEATARGVYLTDKQLRRLHELTSGLPLPIKLSIARKASGETLDAVLRWLGDATSDLPEYCVKGQIDLAKERDINAWQVLLACTLFDLDSGASRKTLGTVTDLSVAERDKALAHLLHLSLINEISEDDRFWLLPRVQGYAGINLTNQAFGDHLINRWLDWAVGFVQTYGSLNANHHLDVKVFAREYPNLLHAINWCQKHHRWNILIELSEGTWFYSYVSGLFGELRNILTVTLRAADSMNDKRIIGLVHHRLGRLAWIQAHDSNTLAEHLDQAEEIAQELRDERWLARIWINRFDALLLQGQLAEAERVIQDVYGISEKIGDLYLKVEVANRFVELEIKRNNHTKAIQWLELGEKWADDVNWTRGLAWLLYLHGVTLIGQDRFLEAEAFLVESHKMAASWGEYLLVAYDKYCLARVYLASNRKELAQQTSSEVSELFGRLGIAARQTEVEYLLRGSSINRDYV